jgi:hypothetical protein
VCFLVAAQLKPGDEMLVDVNDAGHWGHRSRTAMAQRAKPNMLWFLDDDDLPLPDALADIRKAVGGNVDQAHVFKMKYQQGLIWRTPEVIQGNVSTQMIVVPQSMTAYVSWGDRYEGDFDFIRGLQQTFGELVWHDDVVCEHNGLRP